MCVWKGKGNGRVGKVKVYDRCVTDGISERHGAMDRRWAGIDGKEIDDVWQMRGEGQKDCWV